MFKCRKCGAIDKFELMFNHSYQGKREYSYFYTNTGDIKITADGYTFMPDLKFMNEHAVCRWCGSIECWEYN